MEDSLGRSSLGAEHAAVLMAGNSAPIREVERAVGRLALAEVNLLLQGEPGTGKQVLAEAIHERSPRRREPFVVITLASRSEAQLEHELFGEDGALARARGGTLYLNGIAGLPNRLQRRLLRTLRDGDIEGAPRILASTAVELEELVRLGRFLPDLYFHLGLVRLTIPPLRERREDIAHMADHFIRRWCADTGAPRSMLGRAAVAELSTYAWPGNARELQQTLESVLRAWRGGEISAERIRTVLGRRPRRHAAPDVFPLRQLERDYIASVLARCNWNQSLAARRLGIGRNTLMRKIKVFKLERSEAA